MYKVHFQWKFVPQRFFMRFFHLILIEVFHWTISTLGEVQGLRIEFISEAVRLVKRD